LDVRHEPRQILQPVPELIKFFRRPVDRDGFLDLPPLAAFKARLNSLRAALQLVFSTKRVFIWNSEIYELKHVRTSASLSPRGLDPKGVFRSIHAPPTLIRVSDLIDGRLVSRNL
jgi:hypothetical protein